MRMFGIERHDVCLVIGNLPLDLGLYRKCGGKACALMWLEASEMLVFVGCVPAKRVCL